MIVVVILKCIPVTTGTSCFPLVLVPPTSPDTIPINSFSNSLYGLLSTLPGRQTASVFSMACSNVLGKRKAEDDYETKPVLRKHKEKETTKEFCETNIISVESSAAAGPKKTLFVARFPRYTQISDIIDFFKDVGEVVRVRFILSRKGKNLGCGFVEFASSNQAKKALQKKKGEHLHDSEILLMKALDETEESARRKKSLYASHIPRQTQISDIINFFNDVGEVVDVRFVVGRKGKHLGCCFLEFATSDEANKALQEKNGEYLLGSKIFLGAAKQGPTYEPPKYCIDHTVWYEEDHFQRESLPIEAAVEGLHETPDFAKEVLLLANLSPQTTQIGQIVDFFKDVGDVVGVRLIVNHECKHVGYGFVEFASAYEAKRALEEKNGEYLHDHKILLMKRLYETPDFDETAAVRDKTLFAANISRQTGISDIINFFKDVAEVVHVRLIVDDKGKRVGYGYIEFASANEAMKALEEKNGEYLNNREITLDVFKTAPNPRLPKYCIDYKVWYEDAAAVEGLDETPDFTEEVDVRKKTLFVVGLSDRIKKKNIVNLFNDVGEVVSVRLIVDDRGQRVGCGFVEFASADEAKKARKKKNGAKYILKFAEIARYPFRRKYNLEEMLWYEDNLRRESLTMQNLEEEEEIFCGTKTIFSDYEG